MSYKDKLLLKKLRQSRVFFSDCQEEQNFMAEDDETKQPVLLRHGLLD